MAEEVETKSPWYTRALLPIVTSRPGAWFFRQWMHRVDTPLLKLTAGRVSFASAYPVLLLTTTGAKTGKERTVPLLYVEREDGFAVLGTRFGSQQHPGWYHNLRKNPEAVVHIKGKWYDCTAREADDDERAEIWNAATQVYEGYEAYAPRAKRKIPIIVLSPETESRG
jgi:deazaflavin-dependent oxidoreductase (nitroreductase family)